MSAVELLNDLIHFVGINNDNSYQILSCEGMDALDELLSRVKAERIFLLFCGNTVDGRSWCSDCVAAKPIIESNLKYLHPNNDAFITVYVGERDQWKNPANVFRRDDRFKIQGVPTLFEYGTQKRLVESQCASTNLVHMIFEEDDD